MARSRDGQMHIFLRQKHRSYRHVTPRTCAHKSQRTRSTGSRINRIAIFSPQRSSARKPSSKVTTAFPPFGACHLRHRGRWRLDERRDVVAVAYHLASLRAPAQRRKYGGSVSSSMKESEISGEEEGRDGHQRNVALKESAAAAVKMAGDIRRHRSSRADA